MSRAVRAIIIEGDKMLLMKRQKAGHEYYTLVGGRVKDNESFEDALARELKEETSLKLTTANLVFIQEHPKPYDQQYIYLCTIESGSEVAIHPASEEAEMNRVGINIHQPVWVKLAHFSKLPFSTTPLQIALTNAIKNGFPKEPIKL
jgi:ADP-ribose pyrophosphatase YjhB (NUDIX family)